MEVQDHFVEFDKYCNSCQFYDLKKNKNGDEPEPCNECLSNPTNVDSRKPVKYIKKEEKSKSSNANNK